MRVTGQRREWLGARGHGDERVGDMRPRRWSVSLKDEVRFLAGPLAGDWDGWEWPNLLSLGHWFAGTTFFVSYPLGTFHEPWI
jgi:hypothetical protein